MIVIATFHLELFHIINHFSRKHYEIKQTSRCKNPFSFNRNIPNRIPKINKLPITTNKISSQISNMITDIQRNIQYKIATRKSFPSNNRLNREIPSNHEYPPTTTFVESKHAESNSENQQIDSTNEIFPQKFQHSPLVFNEKEHQPVSTIPHDEFKPILVNSKLVQMTRRR